jgi:hypothetical protein
MPEPRATGWYWVRYSGEPEIAFWDEDEWLVLGSDAGVSDAEVTVIDGPVQVPEGVQDREG